MPISATFFFLLQMVCAYNHLFEIQVVCVSRKSFLLEPSLRSVSVVFRRSSWLHMFFCRVWLFGAKHQDRELACKLTDFLLLDLLSEGEKQDIKTGLCLSLAL